MDRRRALGADGRSIHKGSTLAPIEIVVKLDALAIALLISLFGPSFRSHQFGAMVAIQRRHRQQGQQSLIEVHATRSPLRRPRTASSMRLRLDSPLSFLSLGAPPSPLPPLSPLSLGDFFGEPASGSLSAQHALSITGMPISLHHFWRPSLSGRASMCRPSSQRTQPKPSGFPVAPKAMRSSVICFLLLSE